MTISDKLSLLEQTKETQRVKLGLPENTPFSRYHEFFEYKFVPSLLFLNGEQGVWFDPSDLSTMFQDVNGTKPVAKDGDPVGLILDKSQNLEKVKKVDSLLFVKESTDVTKDARLLEAESVPTGTLLEITLDIKKINIPSTLYLEARGATNKSYFLSTLGINAPRIYKVYIYKREDYVQIRGVSTSEIECNVTVEVLKGNHALQETASARPIYRRGDDKGLTNLMKWSEDFSNASWNKGAVTVTPNATNNPNGALTASKVTTSVGASGLFQYVWVKPNTTYTFSFWAKRGTMTDMKYCIHNNTVGGTTIVPRTSYYEQTNSDTFQRISVTFTTPSDCEVIRVYLLRDSISIGDVYFWGAQVQEGTITTDYQANEASLGGIYTGKITDLHWLEFDGIDDQLSTNKNFTIKTPLTMFTRMDPDMPGGVGAVFSLTHRNVTTVSIQASAGNTRAYVRIFAETGIFVPTLTTEESTVVLQVSSGKVNLNMGSESKSLDTDFTTQYAEDATIDIGKSVSTATVPFIGVFYGGVYVADALDDKAIKSCVDYLDAKAGVTL